MAHTIRIKKDAFIKGYYSVHDVVIKNKVLMQDILIDYTKSKENAEKIRVLYKQGKIKPKYGDAINQWKHEMHYPIQNKYGGQALCPKDGTPLKHYDGAIGYEALFCTKCGYFEDFTTSGVDKSFIGR